MNIFLISGMCEKRVQNNIPVLGFLEKPTLGTVSLFRLFKASPVYFSSSFGFLTAPLFPSNYYYSLIRGLAMVAIPIPNSLTEGVQNNLKSHLGQSQTLSPGNNGGSNK
jgi:hypothetical protein